MTPELLREIIDRITMPSGWQVRSMTKGDGWLVQVTFYARDHDDPTKIDLQHCRKWYVSSHATVTEVVRTIHKAGLAAVEHEFNEAFRYRSVAIYHPHRDIEESAATFINKDVRADEH